MTTTTQTQHGWGALGDKQLWCATFLFMAIVSAFVLGIFVIADALRGIDGYFDTNAADPGVAEAGARTDFLTGAPQI